MSTYKKPCRYCNELVPGDSDFCPFCGKKNPVGTLRCPNCQTPIEENYKVCSHCGALLSEKKGEK
jgi:RNA polymerase subunit RPABC4/transcription elongation factor Spt4